MERKWVKENNYDASNVKNTFFFIKFSLQFHRIRGWKSEWTRVPLLDQIKGGKKSRTLSATISGSFGTPGLCSRGMTRHDSLFVQDVMKMSSNKRRHGDVRSVYKTFTRTTGPRTHQRRSHYLMAPTYVFAVSRSLREQSDVPETDRLPTISTPLPLHLLFPSFLFLFTASSLHPSCSSNPRPFILPVLKLWIKDEEDDVSLFVIISFDWV